MVKTKCDACPARNRQVAEVKLGARALNLCEACRKMSERLNADEVEAHRLINQGAQF